VTSSSLYILLKEAYEEYLFLTNQSPDEFEVWKSKRSLESPQFKYWSITLEFGLALLLLVKDFRVRNFLLYRDVLKKLTAFFFLLDHPKYAKWTSIHIHDMDFLQQNI
jgi:hypothetical protein